MPRPLGESGERPEPGGAAVRRPLSLRFFDPASFFDFLADAVAPVAWAARAVPLLALVAGCAALFRQEDIAAHADRIALTVSFWQNLLLGLLTANLLGRLAQGVAMSRQGAPSREFGMRLAFGVIPRFYIDRGPVALLAPRAQMACHAAPLLMRLALFAGGILLWAAVRRTGSGLADLAVVVAGVGLSSFLFTANPLWPADGYRWLAAAIGRPKLRANALRVLGLVLRGRRLPPDLPRGEVWLLLLYAVVSLAFTAAILWLVLSAAAYALEAELRGTGVVIFCLLLVAMTMFLVGSTRAARPKRRGATRAAHPAGATGAGDGAGHRAGRSRTVPEFAAPGWVASAPAETDARTRDDAAGQGGAEAGTMARQGRESGRRALASFPDGRAGLGGDADPLAALLDDDAIWDVGNDAMPRLAGAEGPGPRWGPDPSLDDILGLGPETAARPDDDLLRAALEEPEAGPRGAEDGGARRPTTGEPAPERFAEAGAAGTSSSADPDGPAGRGGAGGAWPEEGRPVGRPAPLAAAEPVAGASRARPADAVPLRPGAAVLASLAPGATSGPAPAAAAPRGRAEGPAPAGPVAPPPRRRDGTGRIDTNDLDRLLKVGRARPTPARRWRAALVWLAVLAALAWAAFLPYPFEVGGEFIVKPLERAEARSRTDGEVTRIDVAEGDWVEAGEVMAVLANWDELRDVAVNEADGARLRADLADLAAGASPEQVEVARRAVATAELRVEAAKRALDREQALFDANTVAQATLDDARAEHDLAVASRDEAQASLDVVTAPPRQPEIDALEAAIARSDEETSFSRLLLEYTNIRAPVSGQVVSSLDEVPLGAFLPVGGLLAELEDNRVVIAEVEVPEITIAEVEVGAPAELRLWSDPETPITGTVRSIAPRAEERDFGWIIRVQVEVPNPDGRLAANMTGFGKVRAADRPAWQAFGRAIERFFVIELWSWVP